jgi:pimeloyl-ACP methyl ester carboxylesterase
MTPTSQALPRRRVPLVVGALAVAALAVVYLVASEVILHMALKPFRATCASPVDDGVPTAEALSFASAEDHVPLVGWLIPGGDPGNVNLDANRSKAVVLIHGLGSCGWAGSHRDLAKEYVKQGVTVVLFDLRAQGRSGGDELGLGWKERGDVKAAVQVLLQRGFRPGHIGLHGTSFGAGTALLSAAAIPEVGAVVADSAFADVRDLMSHEIELTLGGAPVGALFAPGVSLMGRVVDGIDLAEIPPLAAVPKIAPRPIFFLHGSDDDRIPVDHARRLKAAARADDPLWILEGAGHTQGLEKAHDEYLSRTTGFLISHL